MDFKQIAHHLMAEIGPVMDLDEVIEVNHKNFWTVVYSNKLIIEAELNAELGMFTFTCYLGTPVSEQRNIIIENVLMYNSLWKETGGTRIALEEQNGEFVLLFDRTLHGLDISQLQTVLTNYICTVVEWRKIFAGISSDYDQVVSINLNNMIRV